MRRLLTSVSVTLCLFAATVCLSLPTTSHAAVGVSGAITSGDQNGAPALTNHLTANLTQATPGQTLQLAWEFKLQPEWHVYWQNAGDSGLPPSLKDETGTALPLAFPTPGIISIPPITNYGYKNAVTFTTSYTLPKTLTKGNHTLTFKAGYLYCNEICMPGKAELKLPITIGSKDVKNKAFKPTPNLPEELKDAPGLVAETSGQTIQLSLPLNLSQPGVHFIPDADGVIDDTAPQSLTGNILSIPLDSQATETPTNLSGLLLIGTKGYHFSTSLHQPSQRQSKVTPPAPEKTATFTPDTSLLGAIFFAFIAGLILNFMPCVLPVLSLKLLTLVKHHHGQNGINHRIHHTLAYSAGVLASFWAFAIGIALFKTSTSQLGWGFQLQHPLFVATLTFLLLAIALNFFGVFELGNSMSRLAGSPKAAGRTSLAGTFATGILAVIVATPCTVPFMGGAMAYALTQSLAEGLLIFTALGLGLAFPFLIAIPFPAVFRWLPRPGRWMSTFRHALGWPMLGTALWLGYVYGTQVGLMFAFFLLAVGLALAFGLWLFGTKPSIATLFIPVIIAMAGLSLLPHKAAPHMPMDMNMDISTDMPMEDTWQSWSTKAVEEARKTNHPVFVHFTASWCLTCKVTEATVLNTAEVQKLFAETHTHLFRGDWTSEDPAISEELARHNRKGVPLYLLYLPGKDAEILPQLFSASLLKEKLANLK